MQLTDQRKAELTELLADGAAFETAYPALARYLQAAASIPAAADPGLRAAEQAFEIRILHFMTGGASDNPYWDVVSPAVGVTLRHQREVNGRSSTPSARIRWAQDFLQATFAFAIPSPETLRWIADVTNGRPLVEIGAGRGYWARQLAAIGLTVSPYDVEPPGDDSHNSWFAPDGGAPSQWQAVGGLRQLAQVDVLSRRRTAEHVLFLCWPPAWGHTMAHHALTAYERRGGNRLVYIGEPPNGRSASPEFFTALSEGWHLADDDPSHVVWSGLHDVAQLWSRIQ